MKRVTLLAAVAIALSAWSSAGCRATPAQFPATPDVHPSAPPILLTGLRLTTHYDQDKVMAGDAVVLQGVITNCGNNTEWIRHIEDFTDELQISVKDAKGNEISQRLSWTHQVEIRNRKRNGFLDMGSNVLPGQSIDLQFNLDQQLDIRKPGIYHVLVNLPYVISADRKSDATLISNPTDLEITEAPAEVGTANILETSEKYEGASLLGKRNRSGPE